MRQRMLITYGSLLTIVLVGLVVPLAWTIVARDTQSMFIDRVNDTARFASLAEPALRTGHTASLRAELQQYERLFGIRSAIVDRDGRPILISPEGLPADVPEVTARIDAALTGQRSALGEPAWPWRDDPMVIAEPIASNGEIVGAAVTMSPTARLREGAWRQWAILALASIGVLLVALIAAGPLTTWMIRPVHDLDDVAHALTEGHFHARAPAASGPPELRRLATSFNTMADRLATLIERQRTFVSYASHQLRTPLGTLRLAVDNLSDSIAPAGHADRELVVAEIDRLTDICESLLVYARAEATAADAVEVDLVAVVEGRLAAWQLSAEQAGIRLARDGVASAIARTAPAAVDQSLDALIDNAVKFAGSGATVTVTVADGPQGWVDIHVIDDGPGMPIHDLTRAAEPFWRAPGRQNIPGSGLGMTIATALVTASGGSLTLMPGEERGLHALIRLRSVTDHQAADHESREDQP